MRRAQGDRLDWIKAVHRAPSSVARTLARRLGRGHRVVVQYTIWIVTPPNYTHSRAFNEVALSLRDALCALDHKCVVTTDFADIQGEQVIVLGANLLPAGIALPSKFVIYNLEQVSGDSTWMSAGYLELLRAHRVWDYSVANTAALAQKGIQATTLEIGYMPALTCMPTPLHRDIDVSFVGSMNDRRKHVLQEIAAKDKKVFAGFDLYGAKRDELFARSKIVINIHYYEAKVFEIVRCSYLMANRLCVVSESGADTALEASIGEGVAFAPYERLADTCIRLLGDHEERQRIGMLGYEWFAARSLVPILKRVLETTPRSVLD